ncbi:MAG: glycosyltransferase, partial [Fimbriimonadales bacterium]|nr:glycosyltransferase [Fimbriimonadales bacterium]
MPNNAPRLSVVIPAYNEANRIERTLQRVVEYLDARGEPYEVLVVSDGSTDETETLVQRFAQAHPQVQLLAYQPNRGKGYAVRYGVLRARGDWILFSDADLATPIEELEKLERYLAQGYPIAIGSRPLRESQLVVRQPFYREMA